MHKAIQDIYLDYYWNGWEDFVENLEKYILYTTKDIFQIKKSQQDTKLDRDLQNAAKNYIIKAEIFDTDNNSADGIEKDVEKGDEEILDLPIIKLYLDEIIITYINRRKTDIINCLELLVLFHLYYSLHMVVDAGVMTTWYICYNLNLFNTSLINSLKLNVKSGISIDITNM